jgi:Carboxypeptidase regulatory-like domain
MSGHYLAGTLVTAALLLSAPQPATRSAAPMFVIGGMLVQHRTQQPLAFARVTILQNEHPERHASLTTGANGRFTFTDVPQGKYTLQAEVRGQRRNFEQDGPYSTGIVTGPGLDSEHIVFSFPAATSLSVSVVDEENEPVAAARVLLFTKRIEAGWPSIEMASESSTDTEGSARFAHLEPGTFYVAASGRPWYAQDPAMFQGSELHVQTEADLNVAFPITYFGATQRPESASAIHIAEGETQKVQIALRAVPAAKIVLSDVAGSPNPARGGQVNALLEGIGPSGIRFPAYSQATDVAGERQLSGFAAGEYVVSLSAFTPKTHWQSLGSSRLNIAGEMKLNAAEMPRTGVGGRVSLEGASDLSGLQSVLLGEPFTRQAAVCPVGKDGTFHCTMGGGMNASLMPGSYEIRLQSNDLYPKSINVKGVSFAGGLLDVRDGREAELSIVAARGLTKVNGTAMREGRPVSGAMILLVPQNSANGNVAIPRDQSDSDGTFTLRQVYPGRYLLLAIDHGHDLAYHDPKVLQPFLPGSQVVEIPAAQDHPITVTVQHRER